MAIAVPIPLADAQATPVSHVFNPRGLTAVGGSDFLFEANNPISQIGNARAIVGNKALPPARQGQRADGRVERVTVSLNLPVLEALSNGSASGLVPVPQIAYVKRATVEFVLPERGNQQDRKDLLKMLIALLSNAQVQDVVTNRTFLQ